MAASSKKNSPLRRKASTLWRLSLTYWLMLALMLIVSICSYLITFDIVRNEKLQYNMQILQNATEMVENTLRSADDFAQALSGHTELTSLMYGVGVKERVARLGKTITSLPKYTDANRCIDGFYVYSSYHDILLNNYSAYLHLADAYDYLFKYADMDYAQWHENVLKPTRYLRLLPTTTARAGAAVDRRYLVYSVPYTVSSNGHIVGQTLFYVNEARILETLSPIFEVGADFVLISNLENDILMAQSRTHGTEIPTFTLGSEASSGYETQKIDGQSVYLSFVRSSRYGLTFQIGIPHAVIQQECRTVLNMNLVFISVLILVGVIIALLSIRSSQMPLLRIMESLFPGRSAINRHPGLLDMERAVNNLLTDNSDMQEKLAQGKAQLRDALFNQLIHGDIVDEVHYERQLAHVEVQLPTNCEAVRGAYLQLSGMLPESTAALQGGDLRRVLVQEVLRKYHPRLIPLTLAGENLIALLYFRSSEETEELELFHQIYQTLRNLYNMSAVFYLGRETGELYRVYHSFTSARRLVQSDAEPGDRIIVVDDHPSNLEAYAYSPREEERLLNHVALGDASAVSLELSRIQINNFERRSLSPFMRELLYFRMLSTTMLSEHRIDATPLIQPQADMLPQDFFAALERYYHGMCAQALSARQDEKAQLDDALLAFLHTHFMDNEMSLTMLSLQFDRTESYLSARLKALLGENFFTYLERLRIDRAKELLRTQSESVAVVGEQVGYSSASAFGRAFKRVTGCTPLQFVKGL